MRYFALTRLSDLPILRVNLPAQWNMVPSLEVIGCFLSPRVLRSADN